MQLQHAAPQQTSQSQEPPAAQTDLSGENSMQMLLMSQGKEWPVGMPDDPKPAQIHSWTSQELGGLSDEVDEPDLGNWWEDEKCEGGTEPDSAPAPDETCDLGPPDGDRDLLDQPTGDGNPMAPVTDPEFSDPEFSDPEFSDPELGGEPVTHTANPVQDPVQDPTAPVMAGGPGKSRMGDDRDDVNYQCVDPNRQTVREPVWERGKAAKPYYGKRKLNMSRILARYNMKKQNKAVTGADVTTSLAKARAKYKTLSWKRQRSEKARLYQRIKTLKRYKGGNVTGGMKREVRGQRFDDEVKRLQQLSNKKLRTQLRVLMKAKKWPKWLQYAVINYTGMRYGYTFVKSAKPHREKNSKGVRNDWRNRIKKDLSPVVNQAVCDELGSICQYARGGIKTGDGLRGKAKWYNDESKKRNSKLSFGKLKSDAQIKVGGSLFLLGWTTRKGQKGLVSSPMGGFNPRPGLTKSTMGTATRVKAGVLYYIQTSNGLPTGLPSAFSLCYNRGCWAQFPTADIGQPKFLKWGHEATIGTIEGNEVGCFETPVNGAAGMKYRTKSYLRSSWQTYVGYQPLNVRSDLDEATKES